MKVGFIGLGNMGLPMAEGLVAAGFEVAGFDVVPISSDVVRLTDTAREAVAGAEAVILMLNRGDIVADVLSDTLPVMAAGAHVIDCSTIDVASARANEAMSKDHHIPYLDAPVSGGVAAAAAGSLTFMVGGTKEALEFAMPLLEVMGQKIVHCGDSGAGQAAKICNNMILGITAIGTCEAFALADKLGLSRQKMYDVVSASGQSWSMTSYCPAKGVGPQTPADNDYKPGFSADLMLKDLRLAQSASDDAGMTTQMGALATELYRRFVEEGQGSGKDFSAMLEDMTS